MMLRESGVHNFTLDSYLFGLLYLCAPPLIINIYVRVSLLLLLLGVCVFKRVARLINLRVCDYMNAKNLDATVFWWFFSFLRHCTLNKNQQENTHANDYEWARVKYTFWRQRRRRRMTDNNRWSFITTTPNKKKQVKPSLCRVDDDV